MEASAESRNLWAWITFLLRAAPDRADWFPKGKWATIQVIEDQLLRLAIANLAGKWVSPEMLERNRVSAPRGNADTPNSPPYGRIDPDRNPAA
jgi:hypothetical protein